jgi:hypothetical protein
MAEAYSFLIATVRAFVEIVDHGFTCDALNKRLAERPRRRRPEQ